jgi:tetratricopeptide (TPR) repeat protein
LRNPNLKYDAPWVQDAFQPEVDRYKNGFAPQFYPLLRRSLALQRKLVKALSDAGVPLMCGTDASGVGPVPGFGVHEELQEFAADGIKPYDALRTATVNPARYFGKSDEFGTIAKGKRADLLLLAANPLADIHNTTQIEGVMVRGRWMSRQELRAELADVPASYRQKIGEVSETLRDHPELANLLLEEEDPYGALAAAAFDGIAKKNDIEKLTAVLQSLRSKLPSSAIVSEQAFNTLGYHLLQRKEFAAAVAVLRLNTEDFPKSANTWDSLAEAEFKSGDTPHAAENYRKALAADPKYPNADFARKFLAEHDKAGA